MQKNSFNAGQANRKFNLSREAGDQDDAFCYSKQIQSGRVSYRPVWMGDFVTKKPVYFGLEQFQNVQTKAGVSSVTIPGHLVTDFL